MKGDFSRFTFRPQNRYTSVRLQQGRVHLDADWNYDPDPARATQIEVQFLAEGPHTTRIELVHRGLEIHGERAQDVHDAIDSPDGWSGLLRGYAAEAEKG